MADPALKGIHANNFSTIQPPPHTLPWSINTKTLAYADDICILLNTPAEYTRALHLFATYSKASNAKLNVSKTQVFSLTGDPIPEWQSFLSGQGITQWYDKFSSSYLTYLGYPLVYTPTHIKQVAADLLHKVRQVHGSLQLRKLTHRGKVTACNALFSSRIWHALRMVPLPLSFFRDIQSTLSAFINGTSKINRLPWTTLCRPTSDGGLGLIDPQAQQVALQRRWLPLILYPRGNLHHPLTFWIHSVLYSITPHAHSHLFPLFFPHLYDIIPFHSPLLLISSLLSLLIDMNQLRWSPQMCLDAPLLALFLEHPRLKFLQQSKHRQICGRDLFRWNIISRYGRIKRLSKEQVQAPIGPIHLSRVWRLVSRRDSTSLLIPPVRCHFHWPVYCPDSDLPGPTFEESIHSYFSTTAFLSSDIRMRHLLHHHPLPFGPALIGPALWKLFWSVRLSPMARKTWFRLIHGKWSSNSLLHQLVPHLSSSACCPICQAPKEDIPHMAIFCPKKLAIWQRVWTAIFPCTSLDPDAIWLCLSMLRFPITTKASDRNLVLQVTGCTLYGIWCARWRLHFDDTPFLVDQIASSILEDLARLAYLHTSDDRSPQDSY